MTREQIDAIECLESKATAGPWWAQREYDGGRTVCSMRHQTETVCVNKASHVEGDPWDAHWDNANLIQELRNNAKQLLAAARRALELEEALEFVANLNSARWIKPMNGHGWRLVETADCGAVVVIGEGYTPLYAVRSARMRKETR